MEKESSSALTRNLRSCAREVALLFVILLIYAILSSFLAVGCPIKFLTGLSCPGCGLTRAWLSLFALHPADAIAFHPLFWSVPFLVVLAVMFQHDIFKGRSKKIVLGILVSFIVLFVALWLIRLAIEPDLLIAEYGSWPNGSVPDIVNWRVPMWAQWIGALVQG